MHYQKFEGSYCKLRSKWFIVNRRLFVGTYYFAFRVLTMTTVTQLSANDEVKIEERSDEKSFRLVVHTKNFKEEQITVEVKDHVVSYILVG